MYFKNLGSDHFVHLGLVSKLNGISQKWRPNNFLFYNQKNSHYPFFYHLILAVFFPKTANKSPHKFLIFENILKVLFFNLFLISLDFKLFDQVLMNLVYVTFPFSYLFWNAKNRGLSVRNFGILLVHLFLYMIFYYVKVGDIIYLFGAITTSFVILISSIFAFQYILLFSLIFGVLFTSNEIFCIPFVVCAFFGFINPKLSKSYFIGQFNHKWNYYRYLREIYLFNRRKSIFGDFIYGFFKKMISKESTLVEKLYYIYSNPIIEFIYGFPFLWLIYVLNKDLLFSQSILNQILVVTLFIFFIICFRPLRFLGEPQRYLEFITPFISILFISETTITIQIIALSLAVFFIVATRLVFKKFSHVAGGIPPTLIKSVKSTYQQEDILISNELNFAKYFSDHCNIVRTDLTILYRTKSEFDFYHTQNYSILSSQGILKLIQENKVTGLIINTKLYSEKELQVLLDSLKTVLVFESFNYKL